MGIDPGRSGGIGFLSRDRANACPVPIEEGVLPGAGSVPRVTAVRALIDSEIMFTRSSKVYTAIEEYQLRASYAPYRGKKPRGDTPSDGTTMFSTRYLALYVFGVGALYAVLRGYSPVRIAPVKQWQETIFGSTLPAATRKGTKADRKRSLEERKKLSKERSINFTRRMFPQVVLLPTPRHRVPHDGMADAMCIATWCAVQALGREFLTEGTTPSVTSERKEDGHVAT